MLSRRTSSKIAFCAIIFLAIWFSFSASAFSIKQMLGIGSDETDETAETSAKKAESKAAKKTSASNRKDTSNTAKLGLSDIEKTLSVLDENQRKQLLADEKLFSDFVKQEASNVSVLVAARANQIEKNEKTQILAQRGVDNIVRELYLNQLVRSKLPKDFPTEKQVQEYFEQNKEKFVVEERIHVWQIFLPTTKDTSVKDVELIKKRAETISNDLAKKKTGFAAAASKHSKHEVSRLSGGYMGLISVSDMKPEIKEAVRALEEGKISKPIKTEEGIHILKRGAIVPKQDITLEQVRPKIKELMLKQINTQIRQAVFKQAGVTYPIDFNDKKIEEWRLKLRTN